MHALHFLYNFNSQKNLSLPTSRNFLLYIFHTILNLHIVLYGLKTLKSILETFVESFLVLYFLEVSDNNIIPLGIYQLISMITVWLVIFFTRNLAKSKHRINLMRIGIILDFIYFLSIILLKDKVVDYIYFVGLLYGLEEGFYYSVYNTIESDGITNEQRTVFIGSYTSVKAILSIIFPLIFGSLIYATSFIKSVVIVLIIVAFRILLSFMFKDRNIPKSNRTNIRKYLKLTKNNVKLKYLYKVLFYKGVTYSQGAFSYIVTIYIIKVFSNSFSLGVFTSIFSIITCLIGIWYAKFLKKEHYPIVINISTVLTVISLILMIFYCNPITIIVFNLFKTISKSILEVINTSSRANLSNLDIIKKEYKSEYTVMIETSLVIGRVLSHLIFILMAFANSTFIILIFAVFLILYSYNSIKLQKVI